MIIGNITYKQFIDYVSEYLFNNCKNIYKPEEQTISSNTSNAISTQDIPEGSYVIEPYSGNTKTQEVDLIPGLYELALIGGGGNRIGDAYYGKYFYFYGGSGGSGSGIAGQMYVLEDSKIRISFGKAQTDSYLEYIKSLNSSTRLATAGKGGDGYQVWIFSGSGGPGVAGNPTLPDSSENIITEELELYEGNVGKAGQNSKGGETICKNIFGSDTTYLWGEGQYLTNENATQNGGGYLKFIKKGKHKLDIPDYMRVGNSYLFEVENETNKNKKIKIKAICTYSVEETTEAEINEQLTQYIENIGITNLNETIIAGTYYKFLYDLLVFCNNHLAFLNCQFDINTYLVYRPDVTFEYLKITDDDKYEDDAHTKRALNKLIEANDINYLLKNLFEYMKKSIRAVTCQYDYYLTDLLEKAEGAWTGNLGPGVYKFGLCGAIGGEGQGIIVHPNGGARGVYTTYSGGGGFTELSVYLPESTLVEIKSWPKKTGENITVDGTTYTNPAYLKINNTLFALAEQGHNGNSGAWSGNGSGGRNWIIQRGKARLLGYPIKGATIEKQGVSGGGESVSSYGSWGCYTNPSGGVRIEFIRKNEVAFPVD